MRSFSILVLALVLGGLACFASPASAQVIFQDDFEGHTVGAALTSVTPPIGLNYIFLPETGGEPGVIADTATVPPGSTAGGIGTKFVEYTKNPSAGILHPQEADVAATAGQVITTSLDIYVVGTASTAKHGFLAGSSQDATSDLAWQVGIAPNGSLWYYDNGADWIPVAGAGTVRTDQWIHMEVVGDFTARTFDATVDGFAFSQPFAPGTSNTYASLYIGGNVAGLFYDNMLITAGTSALPGDVNSDGFVDIFDINLVSANWGTPGGPTGDANGDGNVDIFDINLISANWSPAPGGAAAVPEPNSVVLAGIGLVGVACAVWTRRKQAART